MLCFNINFDALDSVDWTGGKGLPSSHLEHCLLVESTASVVELGLVVGGLSDNVVVEAVVEIVSDDIEVSVVVGFVSFETFPAVVADICFGLKAYSSLKNQVSSHFFLVMSEKIYSSPAYMTFEICMGASSYVEIYMYFQGTCTYLY